jgi:hypothetical protein
MCTFRVEQIPVATSKTEEAAPGIECEEEEGTNPSEELTSMKSTSFTVKDHDTSKTAESFTVNVGEGGLDPEGTGDWQANQSTGHGVSQENLVPVS